MKIEMTKAKEALTKIAELLKRPLLLIGGLAVNQYVKSRTSVDIDLVCNQEESIDILNTIFDDGDGATWRVVDRNDEEERPNYVGEHRSTGEIVLFGPKIKQRPQYKHIDFEVLQNYSRPYHFRNKDYTNILVPSSAALTYMKLISMIGRDRIAEKKILQDAKDFIFLSNDHSFNINDFLDLITKLKARNYIRSELAARINSIGADIDFWNSSILKSAALFDYYALYPESSMPDNVRYENYLIGSTAHEVHIIAHCPAGKFDRYPVLSPGAIVKEHIDNLANYKKPARFDITGSVEQVVWPREQTVTVFLVDSPQYNKYTLAALTACNEQMVGSQVRHTFNKIRNGKHWQHIFVNDDEYVTTKFDVSSTPPDHFGSFTDYLVIMRLPGSVLKKLEEPPPTANRQDSIVWVVFGITAKATWAGAHMLTQENLRKYELSLRKLSKANVLPEYFEAVFETPPDHGKITDFEQLVLIHYASLRPTRDLLVGDPAPQSVEHHIRSKKPEEISLDSVHFDPVAGCNFRCPNCIEDHVRDRAVLLSTSKALRVITDIHSLGCRDLRFYGGEPTIHPDFDLFVTTGHAMGFRMMVVTNGSMLSKIPIVNALEKAKRSVHVRVSLDANTEDTFAQCHGITNKIASFEKIKESVLQLIDKGISVSVSYLLSEKSIDELTEACAFWKEHRAVSFHPRIQMDRHGKNPNFVSVISRESQNKAKNVLEGLIEKYDAWLVTPSWLRDWAKRGRFPEPRSRSVEKCYSAFYRIGISPFARHPYSDSDPDGLLVTDQAWISFCLYYRYIEEFGCIYPEELSEWWKSKERIDLIDAIPVKVCGDTLCSRFEANTLMGKT